jgi:Holliday junction resolvase RusA-like endonuclease
MLVNDMISIKIQGVARPKQSARFVKGRAIPIAATNAHLKVWTAAVKSACRRELDAGAEPLAGPISMEVRFYFPTNKAERWGLPHTHRPDADNITKGLMDAIKSSGIISVDDSYIAGIDAMKLWSKDAGTVVTLRAWGSAATLSDNPDDLGVSFTID